MLKYVLRKNSRLILIIGIILICSIAIAIGVYAQITNKSVISSKKEPEAGNNYEELENNFKDIFTNNINKENTAKLNVNYDEILYCAYNIKEEEKDKYKIEAKIPLFKGDSETIKQINKEIFDVFAKEIVKISKDTTVNKTYNLDYVAYVNNNIISLVIRCIYKNGGTPQRTIIQTYNYDTENDKILTIQDVIGYKNLDKQEMENKVKEKIEKINGQMQSISSQGYNVYVRNENDEMYKIDNSVNFFLGKNNYLYLIYAYGNNNYTSDIDLVIF